MGNIRPSFIKIRAIRLVEEHGEKFTDDFDHNEEVTQLDCRLRYSLPSTSNRLMGSSSCPYGLIGTEHLCLFMRLTRNHSND